MSTVLEKEKLPACLNAHCLQKALEKALQTNCRIKLENWQWQLANLSGGNFCSNIYRINGSYRSLPPEAAHEMPLEEAHLKKFNFIIKDVIMDIAEIGTNELSMFEKILPEMWHILESTQMEGKTTTTNKLAASCFWAQSNKEHEFYILEDLNALGYVLGNRLEGFSVPAAELVLEKLAKFHATSMIYAKKYPSVIANLNPSHFAKGAEDSIAKSIVKNGMGCAMKTLEALDVEIVEKMKRLALNFDEKIQEVVDPAKSAFNVLNHGDFWVNNILLKEQQETKDDAMFVDFQNVFWGSPAYDLNYFLYTSLPLLTLQTQRFELLHHYYKTLKSMLESFEYKKIPTWSDFRKEMRRGAFIGYYAALCELPICCMSEETAQGFTAETFLDDSNDAWKSIYRTEKVRQFVKHAVLHFEEIGLLDE